MPKLNFGDLLEMAKIIKAYTPVTAGAHAKDEIDVPMLIDEYIDKAYLFGWIGYCSYLRRSYS